MNLTMNQILKGEQGSLQLEKKFLRLEFCQFVCNVLPPEFDYDQSCPTPFYYSVSIEFSKSVVVWDDVIFIYLFLFVPFPMQISPVLRMSSSILSRSKKSVAFDEDFLLSIHSKHADGSPFFSMISYDFPPAKKAFLSILNGFYTSFQLMTLQSHSSCYYMINLKLGFYLYGPKDDGKVWLLWRDNVKKRQF